MFIRLAVILLLTVAATFGAFAFYFKVVLPERRRRHLRDIEAENARYDRIIHPD